MNARTLEQWIPDIKESLKASTSTDFQRIIDEFLPYDLARIHSQLSDMEQARFLQFLNEEQLADMIQEMEHDQQIDVLGRLDQEKTALILDLMDNDDLAILLDELSQEQKEELMRGMRDEESQFVQNIMKFPPETAGRIMTNRYVWIPQHYTVSDVVQKLKAFVSIAETINYLYVIDQERKLVGVVSYRALILAEPGETIVEIMNGRVLSVPVDADQEEVAQLIQKYDLVAIPVVEADGTLVGIITVDDILDVIVREADEDIQKMNATGGKSIDFHTKAVNAAARRLPWLILLLFIGLISGTIISVFEQTLEQVVALAFFMPMIAGMTGNTGTQSLAVIIRGLATKELSRPVVVRLLARELKVGIMIGVICGIFIAVIAYIWQGNLYLGLVVGSSLIATLIVGTMAGTVIPLILFKLRVDPAVASGPLITTINDILSLIIYFGIATLFLSYL
ncbi:MULTISPECIES: magnesium transporter [Paenibacillus]|uniref:Magnesium transporter MgtE n=1 Tax=Paenibacillus lactis TaxID=228574 RepID=A0ABS4FD39_9BACL|nr:MULTISPECIES: magnesium transporter [Paenibacillus]MBP1894166.1 magnesium transporter [Paenibacillus lactis]GIO89480.1 magnesium transporter MgtE [Paenibacillus lactis]HAF99651.1 magnesium transporter [Paenibacillus lactis]